MSDPERDTGDPAEPDRHDLSAPDRDVGAVAGLIPAAGSSSRMGENKLLLDLGGERLVSRAVDAAVEAGLAPVVAVLGFEAGRVAAEIEGLDCLTVTNPEPERGLGSSLAVGVEEIPDEVVATVVVLPDMPFVDAEMVAAVTARFRATGAPLVVSRYGGEVIAPPVLYERSLFDELASGHEGAGKPVVEQHRERAEIVDWPEWRLADVDTPEDYRRARSRSGSEKAG